MNAKNDIIFFDMLPYKETEGIRERCKAAYIEEQLQKRFPEDHFTVKYAAVNESGIYQIVLKFCFCMPVLAYSSDCGRIAATSLALSSVRLSR